MLDITNFSAHRNWKQAVLFYFAYLVIISVSCGLAAMASVAIAHQFAHGDKTFDIHVAKATGEILALVICPFLAALIISAKHMTGWKSIVLVLCTFALSMVGALGGLIIPAYLTMRESDA